MASNIAGSVFELLEVERQHKVLMRVLISTAVTSCQGGPHTDQWKKSIIKTLKAWFNIPFPGPYDVFHDSTAGYVID